MTYSKTQLQNLDRITKLKIINAVSGIKPANLIGTVNTKGQTNLAVFSSVVHLGSNPPLLGFIARPQTSDVGHTFANIKATGVYTINHIHPDFIKKAHYTSAKFDVNTSEFERCQLTQDYQNDFKAPFVKESHFKMGLKFKEAIDIKLNGTTLVIGEIEQLIIPDDAFVDGDINLETTKGVGISGLNTYYELNKIADFPYVRLNEVPEF